MGLLESPEIFFCTFRPHLIYTSCETCDSEQPKTIVNSHRKQPMCNGSGVGPRTLSYENPGLNPVTRCGVKTLGKFFHSTLLQFTQLSK